MVDWEQPEVYKKPLFVKLNPAIIALKRAEFFALLHAEVASSTIDFVTATRKVAEYDYLQPIRILGSWYINPRWRKEEDTPSLKIVAF